ncbi:DUF1737 domain-containing protein [Flavobacterium rhizosphaerae]|uniref:DUF1737 domain-containing protein n=1 Tax=Flavobacterium rhizosphaerae TaxID=3163298 RepID=A0ABW8YR82_9FLAO
MKRITEYELFSCATPAELEKLVNDKIKKGWQPYGHMRPVVNPNTNDLAFTQVIVKYED